MATQQNRNVIEDEFKQILTEKWPFVSKDLQVEDTLYKLRGEFIITDEEEQQISSGNTSFEKANYLRDVLLKKDRQAFNVFCDALEEKYPHLTRILRNIPQTNESEGPMTKLHRDLLTKHTAMLVENIFVDDILGYLQAKFVFDDNDRQVICAGKCDSLQVQKLLNLLPSRGDAAFQHFVDSLESVHPYLVDCFHEDQVDSSSLSLERSATHTDSREYINHDVTNVIETKLWREPSTGLNDLSLDPNKRIDQDDQQIKPKSIIPGKLSLFVGRNEVIKQAVDTFLAEGDSRRIVSLIASPGFGKSATAIEIAHRLFNSGIPVVFVNLKGASTVEEVAVRLCHALGVASQGSPLSSLCLFLQNDAPKCSVLVMDNVEQLLEEETRDEFLRLLGETLQKFHILLTSSKVISEVHLQNQTVIHFKELGRDFSVELVRKCCPRDIKDDFVNSLAQLCGDMPLALRIAASRLSDFSTNATKLLEYLRDEPLEVLTTSSGGTPEVEKCIQMSFDRLTEEQQKLFVRLSVFNGSFSRNEAEQVTGLTKIRLQNFLTELVHRSLLELNGNACDQFSVHTLINSFLTNCCGNSRFPTERRLAKEKMVMCFLKVSRDLTLRYWSKDGCNEGRRLLQAKGPNIEMIWKVCEASVNNALGHHDDTPADEDTHPDSPTNEDTVAVKKIIEVLTESTIYQSLMRLHYHFILHVLPHSTVASFLNVVATVAREHGDTALDVLVQCLKAHFYGRKFGWKSKEHLSCLQCAEKAVHEQETKLEEENETVRLEAYSYYCYSKYLSSDQDPSEQLYAAAEDSLQRYLELKEKKHTELVNTGTNVKEGDLEKVDMAVTYMMLGRTYSFKQHSYFDVVTEYYNRALRIFEALLGDHDMKLCCYKEVGDFFFRQGNHEKAVAFYESARKVHRQLGATNSNISSVYLLKNFGLSLANISREEDALELLKEAYDVVMKLFKDNQACKTEVHCALAETYDKLNRPEAVKHAREALCCNTRSKRGEIVAEKMNKIIAKAYGSVQIESHQE